MQDSRAKLFDSIAQSYDRFNHLLSLGIDITWRKRAIRLLHDIQQAQILDVACGTADFALEMAQSGGKQIIGIDISEGMLEIGRQKVKKASQPIELICADCRSLPFENDRFDIATCAFGVRNFEHRNDCLKELHRVVKQGGQILILEFAMPKIFPIKQLYNFYFKHIMPKIGKRLSGDKAPYNYFYNSVVKFPQRESFMSEIEAAGFRPQKYKVMTFGIAVAYYAIKQ